MTSSKAITFWGGFPGLLDSLLRILSLGFYYSDLEMKFLVWNYNREIKKEERS